jgi:hypothetical protein
MPCAEFEPTIPASEWAKTVYEYALDRSATVAGILDYRHIKYKTINYHELEIKFEWRE